MVRLERYIIRVGKCYLGKDDKIVGNIRYAETWPNKHNTKMRTKELGFGIVMKMTTIYEEIEE